jgi:calcineurin-like phosphoesterase
LFLVLQGKGFVSLEAAGFISVSDIDSYIYMQKENTRKKNMQKFGQRLATKAERNNLTGIKLSFKKKTLKPEILDRTASN